MRQTILFFLILFTLKPLTSNAIVQRATYRLQPSVNFRSLTVESDNIRSYFTGFSPGLSIEMINSKARVHKSLLVGLEWADLKNSANTSSFKEVLKGPTLLVGTRFYSDSLFVGLRVFVGQRELNIQLPTENILRTYLDYGLGGEVGWDIQLGKKILLTPSLHYRVGQLEPKSSSSVTKKTSDFLLSLSLGYEF